MLLSMLALIAISQKEVTADALGTLVEDQTPITSVENESLHVTPRVGGYIAKNHRQTNYKVTSGWYYCYTQTIGKFGASRTYNIFHRDVSYTAKYDLYDQYSGHFIRSVTQKVNTAEEQWRLVY